MLFFFWLTRYDSSSKLSKIQVLYGKQGRTPGSTGAKEYIVRHTSDLGRQRERDQRRRNVEDRDGDLTPDVKSETRAPSRRPQHLQGAMGTEGS